MQVLSLNPSLLFSSCYPFLCSLPLVHGPIEAIWLLLLIVLGAAPLASGQLPAVRGRAPAARAGASGSQGPSNSRDCGGWVEGWGLLWHPPGVQGLARALHICWPSLVPVVQACANCNGLKPNNPRVWDYSSGPWQPKNLSRACWNRRSSLICLPSNGSWYSHCSGTYVCQH